MPEGPGEYFLKITGPDIKGESTADKHKEEIQLSSWSWGENNPPSSTATGAMSAGKVSFSDLSCLADLSKASNEIFFSCASGKHHDQAVLVCRSAGGEQVEYYKAKMSEVFISSYQVSAGGDRPMDSFTLSFSKVELEFQPLGKNGKAEGGPVKQGFDLRTVKKV